ncbi:unnamed protein product, partial [Vitis vinifera]|uniref:Uncharacterized protein n=1 Tax=Vitis vinifera TaxID=29760 RepID=D7SPB4_VITVI
MSSSKYSNILTQTFTCPWQEDQQSSHQIICTASSNSSSICPLAPTLLWSNKTLRNIQFSTYECIY